MATSTTKPSTSQASAGCGPAAGMPCPCDDVAGDPAAVPVERNRFFTGKYMTARDFRDEQTYFLARHRLHQRVLHGWGIVVGLDMCPHPDADCASRGWLVITPGIAIDCYGREIVLHKPTPVKLDALFPHDVACGCEKEYGTWNEKLHGYSPPSSEAPPPDQDFLLGVRYGELCVEPVPVLYDDSGCGERTAPNRILERPCFRYRAHTPGDGCWGPENPPVPCYPPLPATDPEQCLAQAHDFSKPPCPCGPHGFVPLGLFRFKNQPDDKVTIEKKDYSGRRYLFGPLHPYTLTHICDVSWGHGETVHIDKLKKDYDQGRKADEKAGHGNPYQNRSWDFLRLTITFDDALCEKLPPVEPDNAIKFYRRIMRVRYETADGELKPVTNNAVVHLSACRKRLHYDVPLDDSTKRTNTVIHVTLNCDFLPDRKGRAVDGNHLRGALAHKGKTGDGVEGGVFESWFLLVC